MFEFFFFFLRRYVEVKFLNNFKTVWVYKINVKKKTIFEFRFSGAWLYFGPEDM